jgi:hypothetical protein
MRAPICWARAPSRNSSTYFMPLIPWLRLLRGFRLGGFEFGEQGQRALGLFGVQQADGVADVDDHIVPDLGLGGQGDGDGLAHAAQVHQGLVIGQALHHAGGQG